MELDYLNENKPDIFEFSYRYRSRMGLNMFIPGLMEYFKYKFVQSIVILACWSPNEQLRIVRQISQYGYSTTVSCDTSALNNVARLGLQGVIYINEFENSLGKISQKQTSNNYVWVVVGHEVPAVLKRARFDADMVLFRNVGNNAAPSLRIDDIHFHPQNGVSLHPWGFWRSSGFVVTHDRERTLRKLDLKGYPLRIASPVGYYAEGWYNGSYLEYVEDETLKELDAGIRCGYWASKLVIESLNGTDEIVQASSWGAAITNSSMIEILHHGQADLAGGILRIMLNRIEKIDYVMPIWPFSVGFTYFAERESNSNMYMEPFTPGVWWSCLAIVTILAFAQRLTSRSREEKDGSYYAVLATWMQQDANAIPNGLSGRWTFIVLSVSAMLVHAYYTSAIVSALMSTGRSGPDSLRSLADSRYAIASEDYDYIRHMMFSVETNWDDLEYLKKKKMTSKFYQELDRGVELIAEGNTAFHTEYNQIYSYFKDFADDQICKIQHVDTIPETMTWITTTLNGQWTNIFRSTGAWIHEVGLSKRLVSRLLALRPPCRSALLAEQVKFGDVAPLIGLTASGAVLSLILLGLEILFHRSLERKEKNIRFDLRTSSFF